MFKDARAREKLQEGKFSIIITCFAAMTMICEYIAAGSHYASIKFSTELPPCVCCCRCNIFESKREFIIIRWQLIINGSINSPCFHAHMNCLCDIHSNLHNSRDANTNTCMRGLNQQNKDDVMPLQVMSVGLWLRSMFYDINVCFTICHISCLTFRFPFSFLLLLHPDNIFLTNNEHEIDLLTFLHLPT